MRISDWSSDVCSSDLLLIGTQLVTKGYHFPDLTLVGVVDADLGLGGGDLRASERTFQQIQQVAGRAGRGQKPGRVLLQTHQPEAPVIEALVSGDSEGFRSEEHTSGIQSLMRISYAVFCLKTKH